MPAQLWVSRSPTPVTNVVSGLTGLSAALAAGQQVLIGGGSAVDAVEASVRSVEGDPVFDAGYRGYLNQDGVVQLDAFVIDGSTGDFGAVAGVTKASNPVSLARFVMEQLPECFYGRRAVRLGGRRR